MADVTMPRLSDSMEEATVVAWLVDTGDRVSSGQEIAEIETDKATVPLEAELDGAIEIVVAAGETVPLGAILAHIGEAAGAQANGESPNTGEGSAEDTAIASAASSALPSPAAASAVTEGPAAGGNGGTATLTTRVPASPVARRVAHGAGIDLATLAGTGPGGRIVRTDVEAAAAERARKVAPVAIATSGPELVPERRGPATAKGDATVVRLTRTQEVIARRMAESRATVPDFTVSTEVDVEEAWALRERLKQSSSPSSRFPPSTTSWSSPAVARCASSRGSTVATRTPKSSCTRASTSGSRSPARTRSWSRPSSTPTGDL
jgi:pyruvate dehydrogenase E2 component (dihydrolipoamide acetyltransferase)